MRDAQRPLVLGLTKLKWMATSAHSRHACQQAGSYLADCVLGLVFPRLLFGRVGDAHPIGHALTHQILMDEFLQ